MVLPSEAERELGLAAHTLEFSASLPMRSAAVSAAAESSEDQTAAAAAAAAAAFGDDKATFLARLSNTLTSKV